MTSQGSAFLTCALGSCVSRSAWRSGATEIRTRAVEEHQRSRGRGRGALPSLRVAVPRRIDSETGSHRAKRARSHQQIVSDSKSTGTAARPRGCGEDPRTPARLTTTCRNRRSRPHRFGRRAHAVPPSVQAHQISVCDRPRPHPPGGRVAASSGVNTGFRRWCWPARSLGTASARRYSGPSTTAGVELPAGTGGCRRFSDPGRRDRRGWGVCWHGRSRRRNRRARGSFSKSIADSGPIRTRICPA